MEAGQSSTPKWTVGMPGFFFDHATVAAGRNRLLGQLGF